MPSNLNKYRKLMVSGLAEKQTADLKVKCMLRKLQRKYSYRNTVKVERLDFYDRLLVKYLYWWTGKAIDDIAILIGTDSITVAVEAVR